MSEDRFSKKTIGDIWVNTHGDYCLIIDDNPELDESLKFTIQLGFSYSTCIYLEPKAKIKHRYNNSNYIANPKSILEVDLGTTSNDQMEHMYIDMLRIQNVTNNDFVKRIGQLSQDDTFEILLQIEHFKEGLQNRSHGQRNAPITRQTYDYDVAISFAGEERDIARSIASGLRDNGFSVFFDEFETSAMWGSDLGQLLDVIYRKRARHCIVIISVNYKTKIWTKHEFRSALSRRITENIEYILPIRVDDTEVDGLQPTTGYLRYNTPADIDTIIKTFSDKCQKKRQSGNMLFTAKWVENLKRINELWEIDCIAFVVDRRYVPHEDGDIEHRLGVSYGINVTVPRVGFLAPSEQEGINVLGVHIIAVHEGRQLRIEDRWYTSHRADDCEKVEDAIEQAKTYLTNIDDEDYKKAVSCYGSKNILIESDFNDLDQFSEIILEPPEMNVKTKPQ